MADNAPMTAPREVSEIKPSSAADYDNDDPPEPDTALSTTEMKPFRFMDLPAELREKVYQFASPAPMKHTRITVGAYQKEKPEYFALAQTIRAIRQEALAVYFSMTRFAVRISSRFCSTSHGWLAAQDEVAVSCMQKPELFHISNVDHDKKRHSARIYVDMLNGRVYADDVYSASCDKCIEQEVLPKIVERIQGVVGGIEAVDGRKRLTKSLLDSIIRRSHGMCVP